jgi:exonuclease-1
MGFRDFLARLKSILKWRNFYTDFKGDTVGVDSFCWLHQIALRHREKLVAKGEDYSHKEVVNDFIELAERLIKEGLTPTFVFDGAPTPAKGGTDEKRQERRAKALTYIDNNQRKCHEKELRAAMAAAIKITPQIVWDTIVELRKKGFSIIKAPREADAQLVYMVGKTC